MGLIEHTWIHQLSNFTYMWLIAGTISLFFHVRGYYRRLRASGLVRWEVVEAMVDHEEQAAVVRMRIQDHPFAEPRTKHLHLDGTEWAWAGGELLSGEDELRARAAYTIYEDQRASRDRANRMQRLLDRGVKGEVEHEEHDFDDDAGDRNPLRIHRPH